MFGVSFEASLIILVALAFDFVNGFHDAANSIATVVSTRVLAPRFAVGWAAFEFHCVPRLRDCGGFHHRQGNHRHQPDHEP